MVRNRTARPRRPHRGEQGVDRDPAPGPGLVGTALAEPVEYRLDHLVQAQPALGVQLGGEADFGVDDPVRGQVLGALGRHPAQGVRRLHDRDRVPERVEVHLQVPAVRARGQRAGQVLHVVAGQVGVADLAGQLKDGLRAQAAVQVVVQQDLRGGPDFL